MRASGGQLAARGGSSKDAGDRADEGCRSEGWGSAGPHAARAGRCATQALEAAQEQSHWPSAVLVGPGSRGRADRAGTQRHGLCPACFGADRGCEGSGFEWRQLVLSHTGAEGLSGWQVTAAPAPQELGRGSPQVWVQALERPQSPHVALGGGRGARGPRPHSWALGKDRIEEAAHVETLARPWPPPLGDRPSRSPPTPCGASLSLISPIRRPVHLGLDGRCRPARQAAASACPCPPWRVSAAEPRVHPGTLRTAGAAKEGGLFAGCVGLEGRPAAPRGARLARVCFLWETGLSPWVCTRRLTF